MSENTPEPVPVTLDNEQLAQLAAAVTSGLAEYLVTEPVTAVPAEVTVVVTEPVEETPEEPEAPEGDTEDATAPSVSLSTTSEDNAAVPPATDENPDAGTDTATETDTGATESGTETA